MAPALAVAQVADSAVPATIRNAQLLENATNIKAQPLAVLAKFPEAGPGMAKYVAKVLLDNPSAIDAILSIVSDASPQQASAIGAGLVRGVRAIESKKSGASQAISDKVERSDNIWVKQTFQALGPRYITSSAMAIFAPVPPAPLGKAPVGTGLPQHEARIGPPEKERPILRARRVDNAIDRGGSEQSIATFDSEVLLSHGMIFALVSDTASGSGAVSTSPTE